MSTHSQSGSPRLGVEAPTGHRATRRSDTTRAAAIFEVELRAFNGEPDHVHMLVDCPPKVRLSELVNSLKDVSSRLCKKEFRGSPGSGR